MTTDFQTALSKIISQQLDLANRTERAVELGVILPLLKRVGWDTEDLTQIYPQETPGNGRDAVDFALKIGGKNRVFIEAKKWGTNLDNHVAQLCCYCNAAGKEGKPLLAALTNGSEWRLYLPPVKDHPELRRFLEFDITTDKPDEVEQNFEEFLARDRIKSIKKPPPAAYQRWRKIIEDEEVIAKLSNAWNKLAKNQKEQAEVLSSVAKYHEIQAEEEHLKNFIKLSGPLINPVTVTPKRRPHSKPISFTFCADGGEETVPVEHWSDVHFSLCEIMYNLHPDTFSRKVLAISDAWFSETNDNREGHSPLKGVGISVKKTGANAKAIKTLCSKIVARFDYPKDTLTFQEA